MQNILSTNKYPSTNSSFNSQQAQMFKASMLDKNKKLRKEKKKNQNITQEIIFSKEHKRKPRQIIKNEET